ncbi:MAG TPA: hypothetical protein VIU34_24860 [Steroidobacter sp.]
MRKDMYKVIVERPRAWKGGYEQAARLRDDLDGPIHLGMRAGYGYRGLNENLAPLRRYLLSQVGRPWDKVFSEICSGIDRRNTVQQHIHQHIDDFIATRVEIRDGELVDLNGRDRFLRYGGMHQQLYVDPRTGLIRINKKYRNWRNYRSASTEREERAQAEVDARRRVLDERTLLLRLSEVWFEVKLAELPLPREIVTMDSPQRTRMIVDARYDAVLRRKTSFAHTDSSEHKRVYGSSDLYAVSKRQLSKREIKTHGLRE